MSLLIVHRPAAGRGDIRKLRRYYWYATTPVTACRRRLTGWACRAGRLAEHIAVDIGAAAVTRLLTPALSASAILAGYSRLVIDCNRALDDPSSIPSRERRHRHSRQSGSVDSRTRRPGSTRNFHALSRRRCPASGDAASTVPALISIHSFTPVMRGFVRPWHIGICGTMIPRIAVPLLSALGAEVGLVVGDNQPYSAREPRGYTVSHHAHAPGFPHVAIELRQDLVADKAGAREWADRLARLLKPISPTKRSTAPRRGECTDLGRRYALANQKIVIGRWCQKQPRS